MKEIKISIIVPIYNNSKYLGKCIESLVKQSIKSIEIILINDGSTDDSEEVARYYKKIDNRIIYKKQKNLGVSSARNTGLDIAKGKYIIFIDSDDYCELDMLEKMYSCIEKGNYDMAVCGFIIDYLNPKSYEYKKIENIDKCDLIEKIVYLEKNNFFDSLWNKIYRRSIIKKNKIRFDSNYNNLEDFIFNCEYIKYCNDVIFLNNEYYHYVNRDEETLSSKYKPNLMNDLKIINEKRVDMYKNISKNIEKYENHIDYMYIKYLINCIPNIFKKKCTLSNKEKEDIICKIVNDSIISKKLDVINTNETYIYVFRKLSKLNNAKIIFYAYKLMFFIRYRFNVIYYIIRDKLVT